MAEEKRGQQDGGFSTAVQHQASACVEEGDCVDYDAEGHSHRGRTKREAAAHAAAANNGREELPQVRWR